MSVTENIKEVVKLVRQIDNLPLYRAVMGLQTEVMDLTEKLRLKNEENTRLQQALSVKPNLVVKHSAYWQKGEDGKLVDGPFCCRCFDIDGRTCRLVVKERDTFELVQCPQCKQEMQSRGLVPLIEDGNFPSIGI